MARSKAIEQGVKYTVVLPEQDLEMLKKLVDNKTALSVNAAVREAVEEYIVKSKKELYKKGLMDAINDADFVKRTEDAAKYYQNTDKEAEELIDK